MSTPSHEESSDEDDWEVARAVLGVKRRAQEKKKESGVGVLAWLERAHAKAWRVIVA